MRIAYDSIFFELRGLIEDGTYAYKTLLPSETALVKRYECAHNTVRKALSILASHGYVQPIHGKGVRVIYMPPKDADKKTLSFSTSKVESFEEAATRCGFVPNTDVVLMESIEVDDELARTISFEAGQRLIHMVRVRSYDGTPLSWEDNYFREDLVEGITEKDARGSIHAFIKLAHKAKLVTNRRTVTMERANERDNEFVRLGDSNFMVVTRSNAFDHDGLLGEYSVFRHHPDIFCLQQTVIESRVSR